MPAYQRIYKFPLLIFLAIFLHSLEQKAVPPFRGLALQTWSRSGQRDMSAVTKYKYQGRFDNSLDKTEVHWQVSGHAARCR
jgi:hypothetical protein